MTLRNNPPNAAQTKKQITSIYLPRQYVAWIDHNFPNRSDFVRDAIIIFLKQERTKWRLLYETNQKHNERHADHHEQSPKVCVKRNRAVRRPHLCEPQRVDSRRSTGAYSETDTTITIAGHTYEKVIKN